MTKPPRKGLPIGPKGEKGTYTGKVIANRFFVLWEVEQKSEFYIYIAYDSWRSTPDKPFWVELIATKDDATLFDSLVSQLLNHPHAAHPG